MLGIVGTGLVTKVTTAVVGALSAALLPPVAPATTAPAATTAPGLADSVLVCDGPVGDPAPNTFEWYLRDLNNVACGSQRQVDNLTNPAFVAKWALEAVGSLGLLAPLVLDLVNEPTRPRLAPTRVPLAKVTDPFRNPDEWVAAGRGQMHRFEFIASTGAKIVARLYSPTPSKVALPIPGVVFSPGLQSYNEVNSWFAQGLAEAGYLVLIFDPQGQGDSETLPHNPDGSINCSNGCPNFPTNAVPETESAIDFLLSTPTALYPHAVGANAEGTPRFNPWWTRLDPDRVGIAGHSLGAIAVTSVGQRDPRVKAVVAYDNLDGTLSQSVLAQAHAPALFFGADYAFPAPPLPKGSPPNPAGHLGALNQLVGVGVDAMAVTPRASTHYEWGYQPFPTSFPASRYGERTSFYFTLAWYDRYLKDDPDALARLTGLGFDGTADASSIGAGTFDPDKALANPADPTAGNSPYMVEGKCVANLLSFYYHSAFSLEGGTVTSADMRARGC